MLSHINELRPDPANRRKRTPRNVGMIVDALQKVGAARSIVIDETGEILAGNVVIEAAAEAGMTKVQVVDADGSTIVAVRRSGLSPEQKRALAIYDNRTAELAEWDVEQLAADLKNGEDLTAFFYDEELAKILGPAGVKAGLTDPDEVPPERPTSIVLGDLFELGAHRLLCGDSTSRADMARLIGTARATLLFTSPPYADARDYGGGDLTPAHLAQFLAIWDADLYAVNLGIIRKDGAVVRYWDAYIDAAEASGKKLLSWNVWDRGNALTVAQHTAMFPVEHEFIFAFGVQRRDLVPTVPNVRAGHRTGMSNRQKDGTLKTVLPKVIRKSRAIGTVSRVEPHRGTDIGHPAVFPVALPAEYIASVDGDIADPFLGSGTTLMAAEQMGRTCYGAELEPRYCQVIIDRWEAFTGQKAQKVGEAIRA